jgi:putative transposase
LELEIILAVEVLGKKRRGGRHAQETSSEEQIIGALKHYEAGAKTGEICRKLGISQATFYLWKRQYAGLGVQELHELRQLREENSRLKRIVADLTLDRQILQEVVSKKL